MTWTVHTHGGAEEDSFEIAVVRRELIDRAERGEWNAYAMLGYGWFGKDKLLISHNGGPCSWGVTQQVWDKLIRVAQEVADELNNGEQHGS